MTPDPSQSNDALSRLRNRRRRTVPARDTSIASSSTGTLTSRHQESEISESLQDQGAKQLDSQDSRSADTASSRHPEAIDSGHSDIEVPAPTPLDTKQSTMRLERGLSDRLQALGRQNKVCREALIEAMFEYIEAHPEAQADVLSSAQAKNEHRQQIANHKRAQSMMKRFLQKEP